jgi:hypothetical protein
MVRSRVAEALEHGADAGFGLGVEGGAGGADVLADLVQDLPPAVGGQVPQRGLQVLEVAVDERADLGGHGAPPLSRRSTASVSRSHSPVNSSRA